MYVITHHKENFDFVLLGPIEWRPQMFSTVIQGDLGLENKPNVEASDYLNVPLEVVPGVIIRAVKEVRPIINAVYQTYDGPFWSYPDSGEAIAEYTVRNKDLNVIKGEFKQRVSSIRYEKETSGFLHTINGKTIFISTDRNSRNTYSQGAPGLWKLVEAEINTVPQYDHKLQKEVQVEVIVPVREAWINLTQEDLDTLSSLIKLHVQSAFDWEALKTTEIDAFNQPEDFADYEVK